MSNSKNHIPTLVTFTAPTCAGKTHLFNYIKNTTKLPCLISTTTRLPRENEINGEDYYYLSETESSILEKNNLFVELVTYNNARYGVTKIEFNDKLSLNKPVFAIVEPSGIDQYDVQIKKIDGLMLNYYIHTDLEIRFERYKNRAVENILNSHDQELEIRKSLDRLFISLQEEQYWGNKRHWARTLFGNKYPETNLSIILKDIEEIKNRYLESKGLL